MFHRRIALVAAVAVAALVVSWRVAEARNPHCAGGIQYVVGGLNDKAKGNTEDYLRQMNKAVQQLEQCADEDSADAEALGYLGWAYAELDSAGPAGRAFAKAIARLDAKGDHKKVEWATNNRDSYWANAFNDGIGKINAAQAAYPDYSKKPENDADVTLKDEATKKYNDALVSLTRASFYRPNHPATIRNLGSIYLFMGDYKKAADVFTAGLANAPGDTLLLSGLKTAHTNYANQLLDDKKYDDAIAYYTDLLKTDPNNPDLFGGIADAHFQKAAKAEGDVKKAEYKLAADAYSKAHDLKPESADLAFNAALSYGNSGESALAEREWREVLKLKPNDEEAVSSLASTLADEKKFDEAQNLLLAGLATNPQNKTLHRQLGGVYTKAGANAKANEELMVYLAMQNGQPAPDPAAAANGPPDQVIHWEASGEKYDSWFYWSKHIALHFKDGIQLVMSNWGTGPAKK